MRLTHLTASTFFGGPERQMLELACHLPASWDTSFVSFSEQGRCQAFLEAVRQHGFHAAALRHDTPHLRQAAAELAAALRNARTDVLCCHGYKANLVGRMAARRLEIPALAVSRGWTGENLRVRLYESIDRFHLRWMDHVVCVSHGQSARVRQAGVPQERVSVIHNAIRVERFLRPQPSRRAELERLFARPPATIVGSAGRLSPEKGFAVLVEAAGLTAASANVGFVHFGDGVQREQLQARIHTLGLADRFVLAGFRDDLDALLPFFDVLVLPSYTEGLPNVVLEACAAQVPVVATAVGGTPEIVEHGFNGLLVPPGDSPALAAAVGELLGAEERCRDMGKRGRDKVTELFTFAAQARKYEQLLGALPRRSGRRIREVQPC